MDTSGEPPKSIQKKPTNLISLELGTGRDKEKEVSADLKEFDKWRGNLILSNDTLSFLVCLDGAPSPHPLHLDLTSRPF